MIKVDGANDLSIFGSMLHGKTLTKLQIQKRKFLYIEGLIRFLQLYAQNEIGNVEIDIEKIALWVNSPSFENVDVYRITSVSKVYKMLTEDIIEKNIPLYRFLRLDKYKFDMLEKEHYNQLFESFTADCEKYPCLKCIWYYNEPTNLGLISKCEYPKDKIEMKMIFRRGYHDISDKKHIKCKDIVSVKDIDDFLSQKVINNDKCFLKEEIIKNTHRNAERWNDKVKSLDNSCIPLFIPDFAKIDLSKEDDIIEDLGRAFRNKKSKAEMKENLRFAILLKCMIEFVEIYAQTEIGNDYYADISKIAKQSMKWSKQELTSFKSYDDVFHFIEEKIVDDNLFARKFVKHKEE